MVLGERLKKLRNQKGLTLSALAEASALTKGFISQLEAGQTSPSLASLKRLATALGTTASALLADPGDEVEPLVVPHRIYSGGHGYNEHALLKLVERVGSATYYIATLDANSRLVFSGGSADSTKGLVTVRRGTVRVRQSGIDLTLSEGDIGAWNAASPNMIEVAFAHHAEVLLCLPSASTAPRLESDAPGVLASRTIPVAVLDGPFRLVAMRAARATVGSR